MGREVAVGISYTPRLRGKGEGMRLPDLEKEQEPWRRGCQMMDPLEGSPYRTGVRQGGIGGGILGPLALLSLLSLAGVSRGQRSG